MLRPAAMNKVLLRLLPGAALLLAVTIALRSPSLRAGLSPLVPAYPLVVLGGGILLGWRFDRSRLVLVLAVLLLAERALQVWAPIEGGGEVSRAVFGALSLLVPLDLAALAWLPERGLLARHGRLVFGLLAAEIVLIAVLCQPLFLPLAGRMDAPRGLGALSPASSSPWRSSCWPGAPCCR